MSARGVIIVLRYTVPDNTNCNHIKSCDISLYKMARIGLIFNMKIKRDQSLFGKAPTYSCIVLTATVEVSELT